MCPVGGHRGQWGAGGPAYEAGRQWGGLLCAGGRGAQCEWQSPHFTLRSTLHTELL